MSKVAVHTDLVLAGPTWSSVVHPSSSGDRRAAAGTAGPASRRRRRSAAPAAARSSPPGRSTRAHPVAEQLLKKGGRKYVTIADSVVFGCFTFHFRNIGCNSKWHNAYWYASWFPVPVWRTKHRGHFGEDSPVESFEHWTGLWLGRYI